MRTMRPRPEKPLHLSRSGSVRSRGHKTTTFGKMRRSTTLSAREGQSLIVPTPMSTVLFPYLHSDQSRPNIRHNVENAHLPNSNLIIHQASTSHLVGSFRMCLGRVVSRDRLQRSTATSLGDISQSVWKQSCSASMGSKLSTSSFLLSPLSWWSSMGLSCCCCRHRITRCQSVHAVVPLYCRRHPGTHVCRSVGELTSQSGQRNVSR